MSYRDLSDEEKQEFKLMIGDLHTIFDFDEIPAEDIPDVISKLKSNEVKTYIEGLSQGSKPESALREAFFAGRSLLSKFFGGTATPEVNLGHGFVDYVLRVDGRSILIELKSLFETDFESGKVRRLRRLTQRELKHERYKEQVLKYLQEGSEYIILTDLRNWYFFNRQTTVANFKYFHFTDIFNLVEDYKLVGDFWDFLRRKDFQSIREDLDKRFFESLKIWVGKLSEVKFDLDEQTKIENIIHLLNKVIFIQTLDDFFVIDARWIKTNWDETERKWKAKGKYQVLKKYFDEIDNWFYEYYDTELFRGNILKHVKMDETNIEKLYNSLQIVLGVTGWQTTFRGIAGVMQYNFRFIDEDIFGKAYETFLAGVRHDEGIYYTPKYITKYIVDTTVGNLFDDLLTQIKAALEAEDFKRSEILLERFISIRVLDPACGSGSFLIKTVRKIMEKYQILKDMLSGLNAKYNVYNNSLVRPKDVEEKVHQIQAMMDIIQAYNERDLISRLLVRHIHGNDLDKKALEVAKVNIWLEAIKLAPQEFRFDKLPRETNHILPNLEMNLVNGDSVVGLPDETVIEFIMSENNKELGELSELRNKYLKNPTHPELVEEIEKIKEGIRKKLDKKLKEYIEENNISEELLKETKPLHWPLEFWFTIFDANNRLKEESEQWFDSVIGNPPYIDSETMTKKIPNVRGFCSIKYDSASGNWDIFCVFLEIGLSHICKLGKFGYIVPNKLLGADYADSIRNIIKKCSIQNIRDYSNVKVFDASVYPIVITIVKQKPSTEQKVSIEILDQTENNIPSVTHSNEIQLRDLYSMPNNIWSPILDPTIDVFTKIIDSSSSLTEQFSIHGAATVSEAYQISEKIFDKDSKPSSNELKFTNTGTIDKYVSLWGFRDARYIKHTYRRPLIKENDLKNISEIRLMQAKSEKVIIVGMGLELEAFYDQGEFLAGKSTTIVLEKDKELDLVAISGVINSIVNTFVLRRLFGNLSLSGGYIRIGPPQVEHLTVPNSYIHSKSVRNKLASIVKQIMFYKSSKYKLIQLWEHWANNLKNSEKTLLEIIMDDLTKIRAGNFKNTWTSKTTFSPKEENEVLNRNYKSFKLVGNEKNLSIRIIGVRDDGTEEAVYEIIFSNLELMIHTYFSIQSLLNSRARVSCLSDILNKTTIFVIRPNITEKTGNIIKKIEYEYDGDYMNICTVDKEIIDLEAKIDAFVSSLYGLNQSEVKTIMQNLKIAPSYQQLVLKYFK